MEKSLIEFMDEVVIEKFGQQYGLTDTQRLQVISLVTRNNQILMGNRQSGVSTALMVAVKYLTEHKDRRIGIRTPSGCSIKVLKDICGHIKLDTNLVSFTVKYEPLVGCDTIIHEDFLYRRSVNKIIKDLTTDNPKITFMAVASVDSSDCLRSLSFGELYEHGVPILTTFKRD